MCLDRLFELDGRKSFPIDHGPTSPKDLLQVTPPTVDFTHCSYAITSVCRSKYLCCSVPVLVIELLVIDLLAMHRTRRK